MGEVLTSPDAVALMIAWLKQQLPDVPQQSAVGVYRAVPDPRPSTPFCTVRLTGGAGRDDHLPLDRVSVSIEAWAPTVAQAHDLAQNARGVAFSAKGALLGGVQVYQVNDQGAPVELPDPLSNQPRVTFTVQLLLRVRRPQ